MNNFEIKYLIADEYINSIIREKKFDIDMISKKLKIDSSIIKTLFPYSDEINKLEYLKLFNSKIDDEILIVLNKDHHYLKIYQHHVTKNHHYYLINHYILVFRKYQ